MSRPAEPPRSAGRSLQAALDEAAKLHDHTVQEHDQLIQELRQQIELYRRYVFGPRRERYVDAPGQGRLFDAEAIEGVALPPEPPVPEPKMPARRRQSRKPDYDRLPQVRIEHDLPEADKVCDQCGAAKTCIGEDEARVLQFVPAQFRASRTCVAQVCLLLLPRQCRVSRGTSASRERLHCGSGRAR